MDVKSTLKSLATLYCTSNQFSLVAESAWEPTVDGLTREYLDNLTIEINTSLAAFILEVGSHLSQNLLFDLKSSDTLDSAFSTPTSSAICFTWFLGLDAHFETHTLIVDVNIHNSHAVLTCRD